MPRRIWFAIGPALAIPLAASYPLATAGADVHRPGLEQVGTAEPASPGEAPPTAPAPVPDPAALGTNPAGVEPASREPASTEPDAPAPRLLATNRFTPVFREPRLDAPKLGYLRAGALVRRSRDPHPTRDCKAGFYQIEPEGYVCVGHDASLDEEHVLGAAASRRADRDAAMPYEYGRAGQAGRPAPHVYHRIPTLAEQRETEPDLAVQLLRGAPGWQEFESDAVPEFLSQGQPSLRLTGERRSELVLHGDRAIADAAFAFLATFRAEGRHFGLTTDLGIVPLDRVERVEASRFHGLPLRAGTTLPVAFVKTKKAELYAGDFDVEGLRLERALGRREAIALSGHRTRFNGRRYVQTTDGKWLRDEGLLIVERNAAPPHWAREGKAWIDVSIRDQTLVAYEGSEPVFVTLVSTGTGDDERVTPLGQFRVHTKHVSVAMQSDEKGDEYDLADVPYVQYFSEGFALHASYWHDAFGAPKSHGCINLSPLDARWLFGWTEPRVPLLWHGAQSLVGTPINVRQ